MSFGHGKDGTVYMNGYDMTSFLDEVQAQLGADANDASVFQNQKKVYQPGLEHGMVSLSGKWRADTTGLTLDQVDDVFAAALPARSNANDVIWCPQGDVFGGVAFGFEGVDTDYEITNPVADLIKTSAKVESCKARDRQVILHAFYGASESATADGQSYDGAASSANGGVAYLMVPTLTGTGGPTATVKVQHSTDGTTWVDLATFAAAAAAHNYQRVEVSGTVRRYLRASWTLAGVTPVAAFYTGFTRF